jgi:predicted GH43/DUF377 family glycosyl hydrolase
LTGEPVTDKKGALIAFISPRDGYFDSSLTECGPPAVLTDKGIVLLYNGKNHAEKGDKRFNKNTYSAGQVLFDSRDPTSVLARMDVPFLRPMESFEKSGQYIDGTVFIEGLVFLNKNGFYIMAVLTPELLWAFMTQEILPSWIPYPNRCKSVCIA